MAVPKPDFSKRPVVAPAGGPAPVKPAMPSGPLGNIPLPKGGVSVTDWTGRQLRAVGWQDGDPIPPGLALKVQQIQKELAQEKVEHDLPADFKPTIAETVPIDQMPPEYQQEIAELLARHKQEIIRERADEQAAAKYEGLHPSVAAAARGAEAADAAAEAMRQQRRQAAAGMPEVVLQSGPVRQPVAQAPDLPIPAGHELAGVSGVHPMFAQGPPPAGQLPVPPQPAPAPEPDPDLPSAGGAVKLHVCPRCSYDINVPFEVEPTQHDREVYVASILGGQRFLKQYDLFGGAAQVIFRGMTSTETNLMFEQLGYEARAGRFETNDSFMIALGDYRLVMSVEQIRTKTELQQMLPVKDVPFTPPGPTEPPATVLPQLRDWFYTNILPQDTLARVVQLTFRQFQRLLETLEAQATEPSFWKGIGA